MQSIRVCWSSIQGDLSVGVRVAGKEAEEEGEEEGVHPDEYPS